MGSAAAAQHGQIAGHGGGKGERAVPQGGDHGLLPGQKAHSPLGAQPVQQLEVAQGVFQPAAQAAQQHEAAIAQLQPPAQGEHHVGVILLGGELGDVGVLGRIAQGVEVPHHQVGGDTIGHQGVIAPVGGNDIVPGGGGGAQGQGQRHGPHYITDTVLICHNGPSLIHCVF